MKFSEVVKPISYLKTHASEVVREKNKKSNYEILDKSLMAIEICKNYCKKD